MNWAQENKTLAGIVGVMIAGGIGLCAWLYMSWSAYSESMDQWDTTQDSIARIRGGKLAPTQDNVELREKQLTEYAEKVNQLRGALLAVQQKPKPMSETEFQARLKERATEIKRMAKAAGMKELPDDFALGFEKYASQPPRSADVAAELNIHLDAIEKVAATCIESGVDSIDSLERTKLANEDAAAPPPAPTTSKSKSPSKASSSKTKGKKVVITEQAAAEPVLDRYPIKLIITTDQGPFQNIINTLCHPGKMPYFMVVRQVRVENTRLDGPTKQEVLAKMNQRAPSPTPEAAPPPAPAEAPKAGAPQVLPKATPAQADAFEIMGGEKLKVYLEIDYIRFRPAATLEEEAPAAPAAPAEAAPAKP